LIFEIRNTQRKTYKELGLIFRGEDGRPLSRQRICQICKREKELQNEKMAGEKWLT
jgi:hypothetical protein